MEFLHAYPLTQFREKSSNCQRDGKLMPVELPGTLVATGTAVVDIEGNLYALAVAHHPMLGTAAVAAAAARRFPMSRILDHRLTVEASDSMTGCGGGTTRARYLLAVQVTPAYLTLGIGYAKVPGRMTSGERRRGL